MNAEAIINEKRFEFVQIIKNIINNKETVLCKDECGVFAFCDIDDWKKNKFAKNNSDPNCIDKYSSPQDKIQCPNKMKCRDIKLHNDKYLKGSMENEFKYRQEQYFGKPQAEEQQFTYCDRTALGRNQSNLNSFSSERGRTQSVENGNNLSAGAVQPNFKHSKYRTDDRLSETDFRNRTGVYGNKFEELSDGAEESFGTDSERNQVDANADDEIYRTGWEESRGVFEQYLATRSRVGISNRVTGEEVNSNDNLKMDSNNCAILGGVNSLAESLSRIINDESEDQEERRKRIESEQNGSNIGAFIGSVAGMFMNIISDSNEEIKVEEKIKEDNGFNMNL